MLCVRDKGKDSVNKLSRLMKHGAYSLVVARYVVNDPSNNSCGARTPSCMRRKTNTVGHHQRRSMSTVLPFNR